MLLSIKNKEKENSKSSSIHGESNIELLRIVSMILITVYHYVVHGGILQIEHYTPNKLIALFIYTGGRVGVNIFILIMGYFMINSRFKIKKLFKLFLQVFFYSIILAVLAVYRMQANFEVMNVTPFLTPILKEIYWFASYYVMVYVMSPFLNKAIKSMGKENCKKVIILSGIILSIIPTIFRSITFASTFFTWFVYMYIIGAYIKLYGFEFKNDKTAKRISLAFPVIAYITVIVQIALNKAFDLNLDIAHFISLYSIVGLIGSIGIFMCFKNMKIPNSKAINYFGKTSFAVYLLQDNMFYRTIFWHIDYKTLEYRYSAIYMFLLHVIIATIVIYVVASLIETLRVYLIEKPLFKIKIFDKYLDKIDNWMNIE